MQQDVRERSLRGAPISLAGRWKNLLTMTMQAMADSEDEINREVEAEAERIKNCPNFNRKLEIRQSFFMHAHLFPRHYHFFFRQTVKFYMISNEF